MPKERDVEMRSPGIKFPEMLYARYTNLIDYGSRNKVINLITNLFLDLVETHGEIAIGALARGAIRFEIDWKKLNPSSSNVTKRDR